MNERAPQPKVIAWELTRRCPLHCRHCRGSAHDRDYSGELTTDECLRVIDSMACLDHPILILTGGEPMTRPDVYDLASHATAHGMRVVMAPCGALITPEAAERMRHSGIQRISLSLDGATARTHDAFRGLDGAYDDLMRGLRFAREAGVEVQINTTVTRQNLDELPAILELALREGAAALDFFFLVPTGRGADLADLAVSAEEEERTLHWIARTALAAPIPVKTTCAPQYARIVRQEARGRATAVRGRETHGCMAGREFVFLSHTGILQPCGFLDVACGDVREFNLDFSAAYRQSEVFHALADVNSYGGRCGVCEYRRVCGGCRARVYARSGTFLDEDVSCPHTPAAFRGTGRTIDER